MLHQLSEEEQTPGGSLSSGAGYYDSTLKCLPKAILEVGPSLWQYLEFLNSQKEALVARGRLLGVGPFRHYAVQALLSSFLASTV